MRTSIASATFVLAAAGTAAVAGLEPNGVNINMNGSDTLFEVTQDVIASCNASFSTFAAANIVYVGGGSGVGAAHMVSDTQRVSPMSRTLKTSEFCGANQATTEGLMVGLDGIAVMSSAVNTCGGDATVNTGAVPNNGVALTADRNGVPSSLQTLALLYFGMNADSPSTFDCNSAARHTLIGTWANFFEHSCPAGNAACTTGIRHAFRRSDLSGTTDAFVTLVGVGTSSRGIGNNPFATGAILGKKQNPFCNSQDANPATAPLCGATLPCAAGFACDTPTDPLNGGHCVLSDGGKSDFSDFDPIRIACSTNEAVCDQTGTRVQPGKLGVVLPILLPDNRNVTITDDYLSLDCTATCDLQGPVFPTRLLPAGFICPDGQPAALGRCWHPTATDPVTGLPTFACRSAQTNRCFGLTGDGRAYNKALIKEVATPGAATHEGQFAQDSNGRPMNGSFFRLHSGLPGRPDPHPCILTDDTAQIGCLTDSDPCTVGYAGREAAPIQPTNSFKALSVNDIFPIDSKIIDLLPLSQQGGLGDGQPFYPLSRRLYFASLRGFGVLQGGEQQLAECYGDSAIAKAAISAHNFVPVPVGVQCLDYDESPDTASGVINATTIGTGGCAGVPAGGNANACTGFPPAGPTITDVQTILNNNCIRCHSGATPPAGLDLSNVRNVIGAASSECAAKQRIHAGSSVTSYLIDKVMGAAQDGGCFSGAQMPFGGPPLAPADIATIASWIDHGALHPSP
jgi:hypothetical protein